MLLPYKILLGLLGTGALGGTGYGTYAAVDYFFLREECCECECTEDAKCPVGCDCESPEGKCFCKDKAKCAQGQKCCCKCKKAT
ncbi:hypothetical protein MHLP_03755 [Candidatus Mycoplasma haematolamae str. Purdue]|uniref:Metallothionein n=1 Tax=Mycoplasma haematolamae (strain Purdue) TaxID=1212765 RepID=I7CGD9_MYCHA|nr:hypothetical protein [Candidatus Mycoplasma haematolamae]AFO52331.1 hypothetical protein MHLP_03755 [Candidatus Mycoplasma haematolamae str. Purdue]